MNLPSEIHLKLFQYCEDDMPNIALVNKYFYQLFDRYKDTISFSILNTYFGIFDEDIKIHNAYKLLQKIKKKYSYILSELALNIPYSVASLEEDLTYINPFDKALFDAVGNEDLDIMNFIINLPIYYCLQPFFPYVVSTLKQASVVVDDKLDDNDEITIFEHAITKNKLQSVKFVYELSKNDNKINEGFFGENEIDHTNILNNLDVCINNRQKEIFQYLIKICHTELTGLINFIKNSYNGDVQTFVHEALAEIDL